MNHRKMLSAAILLILAKSALGIEFEPNNDSSMANKLGTENVGKLNRASDVDFFSIDSCVKNDKKECVKYTAADEKLNPLNKKGADKRREEVSLLFTCNNRSAASTGGWFLGIHDSNGELQETYPVKPDDCVISDKTLEAFSFTFPINPEIPNYYVSVVSDCQAPIYNTMVDPKDDTKTIVNVNKFVATALTTKEEIASLKTDLVRIKDVISNVKKDLSKNAVINSNANVQQLSDAFALVNSIANFSSEKLTPETNITAAASTANAIEIAGFAMRYSIVTGAVFKNAEAIEREASIQIKLNDLAAKEADTALTKATLALETANTKLAEAKTALTAAKKTLNEAEAALKNATADKKQDAQTARDNAAAAKTAAEDTKQAAQDAINPAEFAKNAVEEAKNVADRAKLDTDQITENAKNAKADDVEAKTKLKEAIAAVGKAVESLKEIVQDNINAANTAQNLGKQFDSACKDNYNVGVYTIKDNSDNEVKTQTNLGLQQSGQIKSITDNNIYVVENDGTGEIPLVFTCSEMAARQTNDWKLSIYNDKNALVSSTLINGSSCGSAFVGDKGGYNFKLSKDSPLYYLSVESACVSSTKKNCVVETAEYSILRDVDKVYTGKLASKRIDAKSADLKLTNCGLNSGAVISIKAENVDLATASKLTKFPINVQIGSTACRILTPDLATKNRIVGNVVDSSEIIDSMSIAQDSMQITLGDCGSDTAKITLTGSKLDLENLNPATTTVTTTGTTAAPSSNSAVIPVKVDIGDFHCEGKEAFYSSPDSLGTSVSYSNISKNEVVEPNVFDSNWLTTKTNLGATLQTGQINAVTDTQIYQVDTGTEDANLTFTCLNSLRYQNDWKVLIYDSTKTLKSTTMINGSSCATGTGYAIPLTKDSPTYYLVVKSACETDDKTCAVDTSQYQLKRISATQAVTNEATKPCFGTNCAAVIPPVKPFFTSPK